MPEDLLNRLCRPEGAWTGTKVAVVVAHPDDETVGAGTRLARLREHLLIVHTTDGAPRDGFDALRAGCARREQYAARRRGELARALELVGVRPGSCRQLGWVDQELAYQLVEATWQLEQILDEFGPQLVLTHPYEGGHPDHDATAFVVHIACRLRGRRGVPVPEIVESPFYHRGEPGTRWGVFLPGSHGTEYVAKLTPAEQRLKTAMLDCFASQRHVLRPVARHEERFRRAPAYDFRRPPHEGRLHYEQFAWGLTAAGWRRLAHRAVQKLGMPH